MHIEKLYKLSVAKFFAFYAIITIAFSLLMAGVYVVYLHGFVGSGNWVDVIRKSIAVGFATNNIEMAVEEKTFSSVLFLLFIIHSLALVLISMFLQGFITARIIKPKTKLVTSKNATFDPTYGFGNKKNPHILFRLVNAGSSSLLDVSLKAFLIVKNKDDRGEVDKLIYFNIDNIDPRNIPIIEPDLVWKVAIPVQKLFNSYIDIYEINPHEKNGSIDGSRTIEILISGTESASSSSFMQTFSFSLEGVGLNGDGGFYCGDFDSLPIFLKKNSLHEIDFRHRFEKEKCHSCHLNSSCQYLRE